MEKKRSFLRLVQDRRVSIEDVTAQFMDSLEPDFPEADTVSVLVPLLMVSFFGDKRAADLDLRSYAMETKPLKAGEATGHVIDTLLEYYHDRLGNDEAAEKATKTLVEAVRTWLQDPEHIQLLAAAIENGKDNEIQI